MADAYTAPGTSSQYPTPESGFDVLAAELARMRRRLDDLERASTLGSAAISSGGLTIKDGGNLTVRDGGAISAEYDDGTPAAFFGQIVLADGSPFGTGLLVQAPASGDEGAAQGPDVFMAKVDQDGARSVFIGQTGNPVDNVWGLSKAITLRGTQGDVYLESSTGWGTLKGARAWLEATAGTATVKGSAGLTLDSGGQVLIASETSRVFIEHATTSAGANCVIGTGGLVERSTSSLRYKQDVEDLAVDVDDVLKLRPRTWRDRLEVEADPDADTRYVGFIAEELDAAGLGQWVLYDDEGRPDAIAYDRLTAALVPVLQAQQDQIDTLTRAVDELRARLPKEA